MIEKAKLFENIILQIFDTNFPALNAKLIFFFFSLCACVFFFTPFSKHARNMCVRFDFWVLRLFLGIHRVSS